MFTKTLFRAVLGMAEYASMGYAGVIDHEDLRLMITRVRGAVLVVSILHKPQLEHR